MSVDRLASHLSLSAIRTHAVQMEKQGNSNRVVWNPKSPNFAVAMNGWSNAPHGSIPAEIERPYWTDFGGKISLRM